MGKQNIRKHLKNTKRKNLKKRGGVVTTTYSRSKLLNKYRKAVDTTIV